MELAVRPPSGRYQLSAEVNRDELLKLSRVKQQVAHMRYLVLLDLSIAHGPYSRAELKASTTQPTLARGVSSAIRSALFTFTLATSTISFGRRDVPSKL